MADRKQSKQRRGSPPSILLPVLLVAAMTVIAGVFAKYITGFISAYQQADTAEFYFLTDLAENTSSARYPVYDGVIHFTVKNHDALNIAERYITYSVFLDGEARGSGTLAGNVQSEMTFDIPAADGDHTITVTSTSPYAKTITLYFRVNTHYADSFYTVTAHTGWYELDIYVGEDGSAITVNYGSLQPDNTLERSKDWKTGETGILTDLTSYGHYKLIFFGTESAPFVLQQSGTALLRGAWA